MKIHKRFIGLGVATAVAAWCSMGGLAMATFPNFSDCPEGIPRGSACVDIQSQSGEIVIKGFHVPLDHSLEIRGAIQEPEGGFVPPRGTNGFFAQPVNVPGGVLGIELPIRLNLVLATAELAGPSSSLRINPEDFSITMPLKVHLTNPLIGSSCYVGSDRNPVQVHLITGTTEPPPPNTPISGHFGTFTFTPPNIITVTGGLNVENSFSIPGASGCGFLGILNPLINAKLQLPSAAGNNSIEIANDVGLRIVP